MMRSRAFSLALGVLFILFSANAYACLFSMALPAPMAMSMPVDTTTPTGDPTASACPVVQCDAIAEQDKSGGDCLLSSTASTLNALKITHPDFSAPVLSLNYLATARSIDPIKPRSVDDLPRPLYSVSLLLLHSTLLL